MVSCNKVGYRVQKVWKDIGGNQEGMLSTNIFGGVEDKSKRKRMIDVREGLR